MASIPFDEPEFYLISEEWRIIPGFEDYMVSNRGRVKSLKVDRENGFIMSRSLNTGGYYQARLRKNKISYVRSVHRLVLSLFGEEPWSDELECRHKNGVRHDNRIENLEWGTGVENYADRHRHGTANYGENHGRAKLTEKDVINIRMEYADGARQVDLSAKYGVVQTKISAIVRRKLWRHVE